MVVLIVSFFYDSSMSFETPGPHPASYVEQSRSETGTNVNIFFELTKRSKRFLVLLPSNPYILRVRSYILFCFLNTSLDQGGFGAPEFCDLRAYLVKLLPLMILKILHHLRSAMSRTPASEVLLISTPRLLWSTPLTLAN